MKLTIKDKDKKVTVKVNNDYLVIDEVFDLFKGLLLSYGYQIESIENDILEQAKEIEKERINNSSPKNAC